MSVNMNESLKSCRVLVVVCFVAFNCTYLALTVTGVKYNGPCNEECDPNSDCYGPGPDHCKKCKHVIDRRNRTCVKTCDKNSQYVYRNECKQCHHQCVGCRGDNDYDCLSCLKLKRNEIHTFLNMTFCVPKCSGHEYALDNVCLECHEGCKLTGCFGPGSENCKPCDKPVVHFSYNRNGSVISHRVTIKECILSGDACPTSSFGDKLSLDAITNSQFHLIAGKQACIRCHRSCARCTSFGFTKEDCQECIEDYKNCSCPSGFYYDNSWDSFSKKLCKQCSGGCTECTDLNVCLSCDDTFYRMFAKGFPDQNDSFLCVEECPSNQPFSYHDETYQKYCSSLDSSSQGSFRNAVYIFCGVFFSLCFIVLILFIITLKKTNNNKSKVEMFQPNEESNDVGVSTNTTDTRTKLQIIKEMDVKKTKILGKGAFGTVYKGLLSGEDGSRVVVAIKVLNSRYKEASTKDILQEASIMAGISHPNLLRLLAICVTSNVMLITQFMPLGDLQHYLHTHNITIKQKTLLSWCVQIAKGMSYLEDRRFVHRDLATRNVLLMTKNRIKLSDFGLARALGIDQDMYSSQGGKLPVKWMALESLKTGIFTHKSDVWSFGVTVWEILTYGEEPYIDSVSSLRELINLLENGNRLEQPKVCSTELYTVLMSCWELEEQDRPSFLELDEEFSVMLKNPESFVTYPGNGELGPTPELPAQNFYFEIQADGPFTSSHGYMNAER